MIAVDDMLPCVGVEGGAAFSRCQNGELWVMLLEKAYAKVYGTYEKITNGMSGKAIFDLTGAPCENKDVEPRNAQNIFKYLYQSHNQGYAITAASKSTKTI